MNKKIFIIIACFTLFAALLLSFHSVWAQPLEKPQSPEGGIYTSLLAKQTPTPKPTATPLPYPPPVRVRERHPDLVVGAAVLLGIVLFGVLRYSRRH